jgi:isocitrate dehydrogenase kinase/phosphatase
VTDRAVPARAAEAIAAGYDTYQRDFQAITRRAPARFESRDWQGVQRDAAERIDLYRRVVDAVVTQVQALLGAQVRDKAVWAQMKAHASRLAAARADAELAETFFNSITRRIFATVGVDPRIEFVDTDFAGERLPAPPGAAPLVRAYAGYASTAELVAAILHDYRHAVDYADFDGDVARVAAALDAERAPGRPAVTMLRPVFYRNKAAYLIGRVQSGARAFPLVLPLLNPPEGVIVDAALLNEDEASIVFSFTRSYFHVDVARPHELVAFLKRLMPLKRVAELYIAVGYHKHGKTELYRDILAHLRTTAERFTIAPGEKGMVMLVFALPSYDMVFKVIRDRFAQPKKTTRQDVISRYQLVFRRDRAGRLVDAQEYEHLQFERARFTPELLADLLASAAGTVALKGDTVVISHLYVERKLAPLNLYLREAAPEEAREAVLDYGRAIKDLAASNIFPGDLLLKNFGVTRHGRVVFYDYDELCLLTDLNFRRLPAARADEDELSAESWFYVADNDVFPEEFRSFLGLPQRLTPVFVARHGDLFGVEFWRDMQARHRAGEVLDLYPYSQRKRFRR